MVDIVSNTRLVIKTKIKTKTQCLKKPRLRSMPCFMKIKSRQIQHQNSTVKTDKLTVGLVTLIHDLLFLPISTIESAVGKRLKTHCCVSCLACSRLSGHIEQHSPRLQVWNQHNYDSH